MTSKVTVVLTTTPTEFAAGTAAPVLTRVEILDASGNVVFTQDSGYEFAGVQDGEYAMRASAIDGNGNQVGSAYTQPFNVTTAPTIVTFDIPSGATISVTPE